MSKFLIGFLSIVFLCLESGVSNAQVTTSACSSGVLSAKQENYDRALLQWRLLTTNASQKEWLRVSLECLRVSNLAPSNELAFQWLEKAAGNGSVYAKTQLALLYAVGIGVTKDLNKARLLLQQAASKSDESAELLLQKLREMELQDMELKIN